MRKNDVRKWIHAVLDLLPLLVIPIFALAVRSDNNFEPISVETTENKIVDFNQWFTNGVSSDDVRGAFINYENYQFTINGTVTWDRDFYDFTCSNNAYYLIENHKYYFKGNAYVDNSLKLFILAGRSTSPLYFTSTSQSIFTCNGTDLYDFKVRLTPSYNYNGTTWYGQLTDLTQMFGEGNEPSSVQEYLSLFPNDYYEFTQSHKVLLENQSVIYNDTDVGSQMVYTLYNTCNKYFNFNNVFNFNQIYQWLEVNIFGGTAPLSAFIAWNIFLYEFIMDLIFLLYALFMFFIDFCTNLIDRFHTKCSGGK